MRSRIALALLALTVVLGGTAIFTVSQLKPFFTPTMVIPMPEAIPRSYFGMTMHRYATTTPWPSIPFSSLRTWDTAVSWADIQKVPNAFIWSDLDALIDLAQKRGVDLLFTLGRTPRWASAIPDAKSPYCPGQCAAPANMQYCADFLP